MKKYLALLLVILLSFSSLPVKAFASEAPKAEVKYANVMGMLYDWKFGEVKADGTVVWDSKDNINAVFSYRAKSFDLKWLLNHSTYKGFTPKLIRFAPVEKTSNTTIKYFDFQDAMSEKPKENFWFLNPLIKNNLEDFFTNYYNKRYNPVTYQNVNFYPSDGKIYYQYSGNYNVSGTGEEATAIDMVYETINKKGLVDDKVQGNKILELFWEYVGDEANFKANYPSEYKKLNNTFRNKSFDPDKVKFYLKMQPHVANLEFKEVNDLAITSIQGGKYPTCTEAELYIGVANNGKRKKTSTVDIYFNYRKIGAKEVTLNGGEKRQITYKLTLPCEENHYNVTAEINPTRKIVETNYKNNKKSNVIQVKDFKPNTTPNCTDTFTWTEKVPHRKCSGHGKDRSCWTYYTYHTYQAKLVTYYTIKDDRSSLKKADWVLNQNGTMQNFIRAGYGIQVTGNSRIDVKQISGQPKAHSASITQPQQIELTTAWNMTNKRNVNSSQPKTIVLNYDGYNFSLPLNKKNKSVIYTSIDLKNGKASLDLAIKGGSVSVNGVSQKLCKTIPAGIIIKGDMYDDKRTR